MEFGGGEGGVGGWVEGIYVLSNDMSNDAHLAQLSTSRMRFIRPRSIQIRPAQKTPGPVPFARLVVAAELVVVDGPVCLVQRIRSIRASVVCQPRRNRDACAGEQQRLARIVVALEGRRGVCL